MAPNHFQEDQEDQKTIVPLNQCLQEKQRKKSLCVYYFVIDHKKAFVAYSIIQRHTKKPLKKIEKAIS